MRDKQNRIDNISKLSSEYPKFKELIDECMRTKYCNGISCYDCSMHSDSVSFKERYYCSCILVAIENAIEESGVDYDGK